MKLFSHMPAFKLIWSKAREWVWGKGSGRVRGGEFKLNCLTCFYVLI